MPQVEMDTTSDFDQIQQFGRTLEDFLIPESKLNQQVPQRLLDEYGRRSPSDVQYGYRTDIGWFVMAVDKTIGVHTIVHIDYPGRIHL